MSSAVIGALLGCAASLLYDAGLALQALDARSAPVTAAPRASLLVHLVRRRRWLAGTVLTLAGWPLQALAVGVAPLAVVQPSLAVGLLVLLAVGARALGEPVRPTDWGATLAILGGVGLVTATAGGSDHGLVPSAPLFACLAGLALATGAPFILRVRGALPVAAGCALAWSGLSTTLLVEAIRAGTAGVAVAWLLATGLAAATGLLHEMAALQRSAATRVAPVVFAVQVVVPVGVASVVAPATVAHPVTAALGIAVVLAGACALLRSPALRPLVDAEGGISGRA